MARHVDKLQISFLRPSSSDYFGDSGADPASIAEAERFLATLS